MGLFGGTCWLNWNIRCTNFVWWQCVCRMRIGPAPVIRINIMHTMEKRTPNERNHNSPLSRFTVKTWRKMRTIERNICFLYGHEKLHSREWVCCRWRRCWYSVDFILSTHQRQIAATNEFSICIICQIDLRNKRQLDDLSQVKCEWRWHIRRLKTLCHRTRKRRSTKQCRISIYVAFGACVLLERSQSVPHATRQLNECLESPTIKCVIFLWHLMQMAVTDDEFDWR